MTIPDLFDVVQPNPKRAVEARIEALDRVLKNAGEPWKEKCLLFLAEFLKTHRTFIGEDFRVWATLRGLPAPHHPNAWGPILTMAAIRGMIHCTDRVRPMNTEKSHARRSLIWVAK